MNAYKIVIRTPNHLGDCVMALPMIGEVREAYPGSHVTVLTPRPLAPLFANNPFVDNTLSILPRFVHGLVGVVRIRELLAPHRFDLGFVLPPSFGAAASLKLAGVKERIGYISDGRRLLLTRPLPRSDPQHKGHRSRSYFDLLIRAADVNLDFVPPRIFISDEQAASGTRLLQHFGIGAEEPFVVIAHQAVAESRRWGWENYARIADHLIRERQLKVVLVGTGADAEAGEHIRKQVSSYGIVNLSGKTDLTELAAILRRATLFLGNDSGPAHLAAAAGTPIVVLSGADDPTETSPLADAKRLVYAEQLECISCVKNQCPLSGDQYMQCMKAITLQKVLTEISELLD